MEYEASELSTAIREARRAKNLGTGELARRAGVNRSTVVRLESGAHTAPNPATLASLAEALDLDVAYVYALAGYTRPSQLPAFTPYLRSKFAGMPDAARIELEQSFRHIADKYGFDPNGPRAGEDES